MGHCNHICSKGQKKGLECGAYTSKKFTDGKYYCWSHMRKMTGGSNSLLVPNPTPPIAPPKNYELKEILDRLDALERISKSTPSAPIDIPVREGPKDYSNDIVAMKADFKRITDQFDF